MKYILLTTSRNHNNQAVKLHTYIYDREHSSKLLCIQDHEFT